VFAPHDIGVGVGVVCGSGGGDDIASSGVAPLLDMRFEARGGLAPRLDADAVDDDDDDDDEDENDDKIARARKRKRPATAQYSIRLRQRPLHCIVHSEWVGGLKRFFT
jgi:hypothetical protein